jgi:hypothetical protein
MIEVEISKQRRPISNFLEMRDKRRKIIRLACDKLLNHRQHALHQEEEKAVAHPTIGQKGRFNHQEVLPVSPTCWRAQCTCQQLVKI